MTISLVKGNIFASKTQTIVNTVNCVGVMGAGLALECRLRYPDMYKKYVELCEGGRIKPGLLWLYKTPSRWILNFPTKNDWKHPSKVEYLDLGLGKFVTSYRDKGIRSVAFPLLGADKGGLSKKVSLGLIVKHLGKLSDIYIEVYEHDRNAADDMFEDVKQMLLSSDIEVLRDRTGIRKTQLRKVLDALDKGGLTQVGQLLEVEGVGPVTLEKLFHSTKLNNHESDLFGV